MAAVLICLLTGARAQEDESSEATPSAARVAAARIEGDLPPGKTIDGASKTELIFAVCEAVKKYRQETAQIVTVAVLAHQDYAADIVETIISCALPTDQIDCQFVDAVVAAAVAAVPDATSPISDGAIDAAPSCAEEIRALCASVRKRAKGQKLGATEPQSNATPLEPAPSGTEARPTATQAKKNATTSYRAVEANSGKEVMNSSGKEVMTGSGKEVMNNSGKEVMTGSGKEVMSDSDNEGGANSGTGDSARSPFHVSVAMREGYDDNVDTTRSERANSFFTDASAVLDYNFQSAQTQFDLRATGGFTYYYDRRAEQQYDVQNSLTLSLSQSATPRLTLSASAYLAYQSQPDFSNTLGVNRRRGNFFYAADTFSAAYKWTRRFSTITSYTLGAIDYEDSAVGAYEDRFEHTFGNEFRFLSLTSTTLVGEYRYQIVDFDDSPRDSMTHFGLAGLDHSFNPRFNVSLRGGVEFRDIDNFGERTSPYGEATLRYSIDEEVAFSWTNRYGLETPDVPGSPSRATFRTGLTFGYKILPRLTASLAVFYQHDDNDGVVMPTFILPAFAENSIDIGLGIRYEINRVFALLAGYSHTQVLSDILLREYARNRIYLGVNATF